MKSPKWIAAAAILAVTCSSGGWALTGEEINSFLKSLSKKTDMSKAYVALVDMRGSEPVSGGYRANEIIAAASVIKLAHMSEAYHAAQEGRIKFTDKVTITQGNFTDTWEPEGDSFPKISVGDEWSIEDLVSVMIGRSDNIATNTFMDVLGRDKITEFAQSMGCTNTYVRHKLSGGMIDVDDPDATGWNQMPAADAARILALINSRKMVSPEASEKMLKKLEGQMDRDLIAAALPPEATYAGKTGELSHGRNDAAIVRGKDRNYVLVIYTTMEDKESWPVFHSITKAVDKFLLEHK